MINWFFFRNCSSTSLEVFSSLPVVPSVSNTTSMLLNIRYYMLNFHCLPTIFLFFKTFHRAKLSLISSFYMLWPSKCLNGLFIRPQVLSVKLPHIPIFTNASLKSRKWLKYISISASCGGNGSWMPGHCNWNRFSSRFSGNNCGCY